MLKKTSLIPAKNNLLGLEDDQKAIHIMTDFSSQDTEQILMPLNHNYSAFAKREKKNQCKYPGGLASSIRAEILQCLLSCGLIFFGMNILRFSSLSIKALFTFPALFRNPGHCIHTFDADRTILVFERHQYALIASKIKEEKRSRLPLSFQQLHRFCPDIITVGLTRPLLVSLWATIAPAVSVETDISVFLVILYLG